MKGILLCVTILAALTAPLTANTGDASAPFLAELESLLRASGWSGTEADALVAAVDELAAGQSIGAVDAHAAEAAAYGLGYLHSEDALGTAENSARIALELARTSQAMRQVGIPPLEIARSTSLGLRNISRHLQTASESISGSRFAELVRNEMQQSAVRQARRSAGNQAQSRLHQVLSEQPEIDIPAPPYDDTGAPTRGDDIPQRP